MTTHREHLFERGLCRSCEMPLLDEELAAGATNCGVCHAVRARAKAMKRWPDQSPQEVDAYYRPRIARELACPGRPVGEPLAASGLIEA